MGNLARRYPEGQQAPQDPKLKIPDVGSAGAKAAAERTVSTGEIAALRKEIAAMGLQLVALKATDAEWSEKFGALAARIAALEAKPATPDFGTVALMNAEIEKARGEDAARDLTPAEQGVMSNALRSSAKLFHKARRDAKPPQDGDAKPAQGGDAKSVVYFIGSDAGQVKIGTTTRPIRERLKALQGAHPAKLQVLAIMPGDAKVEAGLHARFASLRLSGEWFSRSSEMDALIAQHSGAVDATVNAASERPRKAKRVSSQPRRPGRPTKHIGEPWKAEGVSRSTWMRRQKAKAK